MNVDLHRHFSGSISCNTVARIAGMSLEEVTDIMVYKPDDIFCYESFFTKFKILDQINWSLGLISLAIQDVVWKLKQEGVDYAEIKFSIEKYLKFVNMPIDKFVLWFINEFDIHSSEWGIHIDLILSLKHGMNRERQLEIASCIKNDLVAQSIAGIDVVGNENYFCAEFYKSIFHEWDNLNKACMIHVGEIDKPDNVRQAIKTLPIDRICHGIAAADDKEVAAISRDREIVFDLCLTSNICTGVADPSCHPIRKMLDNGFLITIGTDDPVIFNTTLDKEYRLFKEMTGLSDEEIDIIKEATPSLSAESINIKKSKSRTKII